MKKRQLLSVIMAVAMVFSAVPTAVSAEDFKVQQTESKANLDIDAQAALQALDAGDIILNHIYGGGGKEETPISNSFIELYNPTEAEISLVDYKVVYSDSSAEKALSFGESDKISPKGSYLIIGAAEANTDSTISYILPDGDVECDWAISNKKYTVTLEKNNSVVDKIEAGIDGDSNVKISKQKSLQRISHQDTDTTADFRIVSWKIGELEVTAENLSEFAPYNSKGEFGVLKNSGSSEGGSESSTETTTEAAVEPNINTKSDRDILKYIESYSTGFSNADGGVAEIVKYNPENNYMYLVSGQTQTLDIVSINSEGKTEKIKSVDIATLGSENGFVPGDITSVDVNTKRDIIAIAVQHSDYDKNGCIVVLNYEGEFAAKYDAGVQPDMITFTPDGKYILTADEGEPREGYGTEFIDPKGSVTLVDLDTASAETITFESVDSSRNQLLADGVLLKKDTMPSLDLEPEYIAVDDESKTAYVTLQENNAVAALNIADRSWKYIKGLGFKDHNLAENALDIDVDGKADIRCENLYGVYMPDSIAYVKINGNEYLLTANEGDAREWGSYANIDSKKLTLSDGEAAGKKIDYLVNSSTDGLEDGKTYILGGRSFSMLKADNLELVYESGSSIESKTAELYPDYFNSPHDGAGELDKRSNKKGPEPEGVAVLHTNNRYYAVVGLERMGGIMLFDITEPNKTEYADYLNVRDFTVDDISKAGDLGAEGICTISAADSPTSNAMILTANEISGTITIAQIIKVRENDDDTDKPAGIWGDADLSGKLTSNDSAVILAHVLNPASVNLSDNTVALCNVNADGDVTSSDAAMVLQKVLDAAFTFPAEL